MLDRKRKIENLLEDFRAVQHRMVKAGQAFSNELKITPTQFILLHIVSDNEGMSIKELASIMSMTSSAATQQVDNLVRKGYLIREGSIEDRRTLRISLADKAKKQLDALKVQHLEKMYSVYNVLTDEEFLTYCELNEKIANQLLEK